MNTVIYCCKVGHFNMGLEGKQLALGESLKLPFEEQLCCMCVCVHRYFFKPNPYTCKQRFRSLKIELLENSCPVEDSHKRCLWCLCVDRKTEFFWLVSCVWQASDWPTCPNGRSIYATCHFGVCLTASRRWGWDFFLNWWRNFFKFFFLNRGF